MHFFTAENLNLCLLPLKFFELCKKSSFLILVNGNLMRGRAEEVLPEFHNSLVKNICIENVRASDLTEESGNIINALLCSDMMKFGPVLLYFCDLCSFIVMFM